MLAAGGVLRLLPASATNRTTRTTLDRYPARQRGVMRLLILRTILVLGGGVAFLSTRASSQCTPLADEEPRSRTLQCNETHPCTRFRAASGRGGGGTGVNCDHGCATEFAEVGDCVAHLIVTDDMLPGVWRSCNKTVAVLEIFPREPYPPTCSGKPIKTVVYSTEATCRVFVQLLSDWL